MTINMKIYHNITKTTIEGTTIGFLVSREYLDNLEEAWVFLYWVFFSLGISCYLINNRKKSFQHPQSNFPWVWMLTVHTNPPFSICILSLTHVHLVGTVHHTYYSFNYLSIEIKIILTFLRLGDILFVFQTKVFSSVFNFSLLQVTSYFLMLFLHCANQSHIGHNITTAKAITQRKNLLFCSDYQE